MVFGGISIRSASSSTRTACWRPLRAAAAQGPRGPAQDCELDLCRPGNAEAQKLADETFIPSPAGRWLYQPLAELGCSTSRALRTRAGYARSSDLPRPYEHELSTKDFWPPLAPGREAHASAVDDVIVVRLVSTRPGPCTWCCNSASRTSSRC